MLRLFISLFLVKLPVQILGLLIVALAIPFRYSENTVENDGLSRQYSQYPELGSWTRWRLPKWALWWDNAYDGLTGDKRGWWANECRKAGRTEYSFLSMYIWAALRNSANYFSRYVSGVDVSDCTIKMIAGNAEKVDESGASGKSWQHLVAINSKGKEFHRIFGSFPLFGKRSVLVNLGWKIKLDQNGTPKDARGQDRFKGNTIQISVRTRV